MEKIDKPLVTIITVSYNAVTLIEKTMLSIINQSYSNIEYIVIDGGSTDGTVDIIRNYNARINYWISETDFGIYDAMNKGIDLATGNWINFMNCGDYFYNDNVIENFIDISLNNTFDIFYGDSIFKFKWGNVLWKPHPLNQITKVNPLTQQSCFFDTCLMKEKHFDLKYPIAADYNFIYISYFEGKAFFYEPMLISVYIADIGVSVEGGSSVHKEFAKIAGKEKSFIYESQYVLHTLRILFHRLLKRIFPSIFLSFYRKIKFKKRMFPPNI